MIEQVVRAVVARMGEAAALQAAPGSALPPTAAPASAGSAAPAGAIPVELSARHVHLSQEDLLALFGTDTLPSQRAISQPGQYLSTLRVRLIGPKGMLDNVAVLGSVRRETQAEISATDARALGVNAPVNLSGDLRGAAAVAIQAGEQMLRRNCAIVARRHVHMTPQDAATFAVQNGQEISLRVEGARPLTLEGVVVRVATESSLALHIDADEANAAGAWDHPLCRPVCAPTPGCPAPLQGGQPARGMRTDPPAPPPQAVPAGQAPEACVEAKLICERDVLALAAQGAKTLRLRRGQLITPLALDALKARGVALAREERA